MRRLISGQPRNRFQDNVIVVSLIAALFGWLWIRRGFGPATVAVGGIVALAVETSVFLQMLRLGRLLAGGGRLNGDDLRRPVVLGVVSVAIHWCCPVSLLPLTEVAAVIAVVLFSASFVFRGSWRAGR